MKRAKRSYLEGVFRGDRKEGDELARACVYVTIARTTLGVKSAESNRVADVFQIFQVRFFPIHAGVAKHVPFPARASRGTTNGNECRP